MSVSGSQEPNRGLVTKQTKIKKGQPEFPQQLQPVSLFLWGCEVESPGLMFTNFAALRPLP